MRYLIGCVCVVTMGCQSNSGKVTGDEASADVTVGDADGDDDEVGEDQDTDVNSDSGDTAVVDTAPRSTPNTISRFNSPPTTRGFYG